MSGSVLTIRGLCKSFGGTQALDDVSLDVAPGEVHALLGQNGSGKSTLIKILSGYHAPDAGDITIGGIELRLPATLANLRDAGLGFVHQDLGLVGSLSVLDNLRVCRYTTGFGRHIRWKQERARLATLVRRFGLALNPDRPVGELTRAEQTIVAILRALQDLEDRDRGRLLVLDEPTTALPAHEVSLLFDMMKQVAEDECAVLFVTHDVGEVFRICDRVSVLRDGRLVATNQVTNLEERNLIRLIVGRELEELYPDLESHAAEELMVVDGIEGRLANDVRFALRAGEILGLTGLVGAGHEEVPYLIYGAERPSRGRIVMDGVDLGTPTVTEAMAAGMALLPGDRSRQGGIPAASVRENVTISSLASFRRGLRVRHADERSAVGEALIRFDVVPRDQERPLATLSGGNQQKALLARWMRTAPRVLLLHEPVQGIDVGARAAIFNILRDSVAAGASILYASNDYEDLAHVCDRVLVFRRGRIVAELRDRALTTDQLTLHCYQGAAA